jgi:hypothetical protein
VGSSARLTFQVGHVDPPQGKVILPEVKEILTEHEASMARKMKENIGVDLGAIHQFIKAISFSF